MWEGMQGFAEAGNYLDIYIYICVCVCVYIYTVYIYIYTHIHLPKVDSKRVQSSVHGTSRNVKGCGQANAEICDTTVQDSGLVHRPAGATTSGRDRYLLLQGALYFE